MAAGPLILSLALWTIVMPASDRPVEADRTLQVSLVDEMPRIDGRLDEAVWTGAAVASDFVQTEPSEGLAANQPTEVRVLFTAHYLVIGARLHDREGSRITANQFLRDGNLDGNDTFQVYLDTFRDRRNAFFFATNPVGVERDGLVRDEGGTVNWEWDGIWLVACTRDEGGWTAEIAIPFSTLRFHPESGEGWGLNFGRVVARTRERTYWSPVKRDWGFSGQFRVSSYGELSGISGTAPASRLSLKPYVLTGAERDIEDNPTGTDFAHKVGLDAKVALTPTIVADLTVNTDFAQVESDQEQVNLTRFPLFFPEKREFFLENAGLFQVGEPYDVGFGFPSTLLFFSRQIGITEDGDPVRLLGGARVTGKIGAYDVGAMDIVADNAALEDGTPIPRTNFAAVRVKRNVLARSSIGGLLLSKSPADDGSSNQVAAADANFALAHNTNIQGFAAVSQTPGDLGTSHAASVSASHENDRWSTQASYTDIGDDFRSELGFIERTGIRKAGGNVFLSRRPPHFGIRRIFVGNDFRYIADRQGELQSRINTVSSFVIFHNGTFLDTSFTNDAEGLDEAFDLGDVTFAPGRYDFNQGSVQINTDPGRAVSGRGGVTAGGFYDGKLRSYQGTLRVRPTDRLTFEATYLRDHVDIEARQAVFLANVFIGRASYAFSPRAFVRALIQTNDDEHEARANVLFRYTYRPGADLFVVYNENRDFGLEDNVVKDRQFLVKLTVFFTPM